MKVYTRLVIDMASGDVNEAETESHEYYGPVALCKGGSTTQTTQQEIDPQVREAVFGQNGVFTNAQQVYQHHQQNPYNALQIQALQGLQNWNNGDSMKNYMDSSNALAQKYLGQAGVNYQPVAYQPNKIDISSLLNPTSYGSAATAPATSPGNATPTTSPLTQAGNTATIGDPNKDEIDSRRKQ